MRGCPYQTSGDERSGDVRSVDERSGYKRSGHKTSGRVIWYKTSEIYYKINILMIIIKYTVYTLTYSLTM
jgi:hypothetical protein